MITNKNIYKFSETLLLFYEKADSLQKLLKKIQELKKVWDSNNEIRDFFFDPSIGNKDKKHVVKEFLDPFGFEPYVLNLFYVMIDNKMHDYFSSFIDQLIADILIKLGIKNVYVSSSEAFTKKQKERFEEAFKKRLKCTIIFNYKVDKTLILGVKVKYDDTVEGISLSSQLEKITKQLSCYLIK